MSLPIFTQRVLPMKDKLFRLAWRLLGNREEAEDAVQEVMMKIWARRAEWGEWQSLEAYCMRSARNECLDRLRKLRVASVGEDKVHELSSDYKDPYEQMRGKEIFDQVRRCMDDLPENQQLVVQLREMEGFSYQEIADVLDMTMEQVKINLFRARAAIRSTIIREESSWSKK